MKKFHATQTEPCSFFTTRNRTNTHPTNHMCDNNERLIIIFVASRQVFFLVIYFTGWLFRLTSKSKLYSHHLCFKPTSAHPVRPARSRGIPSRKPLFFMLRVLEFCEHYVTLHLSKPTIADFQCQFSSSFRIANVS